MVEVRTAIQNDHGKLEKRVDKSLVDCNKCKCGVLCQGWNNLIQQFRLEAVDENQKSTLGGCLSGEAEQELAVCPCSRGGQLRALLARVPEKVKGGVSLPLLDCSKTNSEVLCALVGSPVHERHGHPGVSPAEAIRD